jgi:hypothetical protein
MSTTVVKLSHLLDLRVEDQDGRSLGHVHDVRVRRVTSGEPGRPPTYQVDELIVGTRGLRVRLGWRRARGPDAVSPGDVVGWDDVLAIESDRLVIRDSGRRDDVTS